MKVSAIYSGYPSIEPIKTKNVTAPLKVTPSENKPIAITFKSGNPKHLFHQISELNIFGQGAGGVATVGNDLFFNIKDFDRVVENIPLYNQEVVYKKELDANGKLKNIVPDGVQLRKIPKELPANHPLKAYEGANFITNIKIPAGADLTELFAKPENASKVFILDELGQSTMSWGLEKDVPIQIFKARKDERLTKFLRDNKNWSDEMINKIDLTFTYVDATASMAAPYADGSYSFAMGDEAAKNISVNWQGKPYAKEAKSTAELMPVLKEKMGGFDPKFVVCHDGQAMPLLQFIAEKNAAGIDYYKDKVVTAYGHNLCDGYMYDMSIKDAIICLAKPDEVQKIVNSKEYMNALKTGNEETFLKTLLPKELLNSRGQVNAVMFPIAYGEKGYLPMFTTVSDGYYKSIISNPEVSPALHQRLKNLSEQGRFRGILNVLMDPLTSGFTTKGLTSYYQNDCKVKLADGKEITFDKFKAFDEANKYDLKNMREVKRHNKISLVKRLDRSLEEAQLYGKGKDGAMTWLDKGTGFSAAVTGLTGKDFTIKGGIDKKYLQMLEKGQDVPVFVSWGRGDFQKGMDTGLESFAKYVKKSGDKNSLYIFGGDMSNIRSDIDKLLEKYTNPGGLLEGRVVCLDGWAPGTAFAAAGDYAVLPSRFAPCELTDLEAMKKGCVPIVPKVQGMDQKVFDPTEVEHALMANGYKCKHEYFMSEADALATANADAVKEYNKTKNKLIKEITGDYKLKTGESTVPEEYLTEKLHAKNEYRQVLRRLRDSIIEDETADSMQRAIKDRNTDTAKNIWKNQIDLKTTWEENGILNPGNKSTGQLTKEMHFNPSYGKNLNSGEELKLDLSKLTDVTTEESGTLGARIRKFFNSKGGKWTIAGICAAAIAGVGYSIYKNKNKNTVEPNTDTFTSSKTTEIAKDNLETGIDEEDI